MPIEIRELVIRATVDPGETKEDSSSSWGAKPSAQGPSQADAYSEDDLVQTCVREVLRVLNDKQER